MRLGVDVAEHGGDLALAVDHEGRALDALYRRPFRTFSTQTPYASATLWSGSASSVNGSVYFDLKRACEATSSGLTPRTTAPRSRKAA